MNKKTMVSIPEHKLASLVVAVIVLGVLNPVVAEPTGNPVNVTSFRPYNNPAGGVIFFDISSPTPCATTGYKIDLSYIGSKEIYATLLTAAASGKQIKVEVLNSSGCAGWGTTVQSVFLIP